MNLLAIVLTCSVHSDDMLVRAIADNAHGNALQPNEFRQFNRIIESAYGSGAQMYNARIVVEVTGGSGRVSAYASVLDNSSLDPTYVPAQ